jgi:predicted nucleic acid-binding protein
MTDYLLDTNLLILGPNLSILPEPRSNNRFFTASICYAELIEGEFSDDPETVANSILQYISAFEDYGEGIPFGQDEVNSYRAMCAAVTASGRKLTRARRVDTMIAAIAHANKMTIATRNTDDFKPFEKLVPVIEL